jgi:Cdc6-like AAA superfamily ATPase
MPAQRRRSQKPQSPPSSHGKSVSSASSTTFSFSDVAVCRRAVNAQLNTHQLPPRLHGLTSCEEALTSSLSQYIRAQESTAILLSGFREGGKSAVLRKSVNAVALEVGSDNVREIYLCGLVHVTDKLAYSTICTALYDYGELPSPDFTAYGGGFRGVLQARAQILAQNADGNTHPSTVIVALDEFETFCVSNRQSFLYSILDGLHEPAANIIIVACSTRIDALDLLEKRVRSRFSGKVFFVSPFSFTPVLIQDILTDRLTLAESKADSLQLSVSQIKRWNIQMTNWLQDPQIEDILAKVIAATCSIRMLLLWTRLTFALWFVDAQPQLKEEEEKEKEATLEDKQRQDLKNSLLVDLSTKNMFVSHGLAAWSQLVGDNDMLERIASLPLPSLVLLSAVRRQAFAGGSDHDNASTGKKGSKKRTHTACRSVNFESIWNECSAFFARHMTMQRYSQDFLFKYWDHLIAQGLLCAADSFRGVLGSSSSWMVQVIPAMSLRTLEAGFTRADQVYMSVPTALLQWATRWEHL